MHWWETSRCISACLLPSFRLVKVLSQFRQHQQLPSSLLSIMESTTALRSKILFVNVRTNPFISWTKGKEPHQDGILHSVRLKHSLSWSLDDKLYKCAWYPGGFPRGACHRYALKKSFHNYCSTRIVHLDFSQSWHPQQRWGLEQRRNHFIDQEDWTSSPCTLA